MTILIENPEFDQAVAELSAGSGESPELLVQLAVHEKLQRMKRLSPAELVRRVEALTAHLPRVPSITTDEMNSLLGYNEDGHFG